MYSLDWSYGFLVLSLLFHTFSCLFVVHFGRILSSNHSTELKNVCHNFKFQELFIPQIFLCNGTFLFNGFYLVSPKIIMTLDCYFMPERRKYVISDLAGSASNSGAHAEGHGVLPCKMVFWLSAIPMADLRI